MFAHAIAVLEVAKQQARVNDPIHAGAGDYAQANLCADVADECAMAIAELQEIAEVNKAATK